MRSKLFVLLVISSCLHGQNSVNAKIDALYDSILIHRQELNYLTVNRTSYNGSLINVLDYGAKNTGYESDSVVNFNAIKEAWNSNPHGTLYFPSGVYVTKEFGSKKDGFVYGGTLTNIQGDGVRSSIIKLASSGKNHLMNIHGTYWHNFTIKDIGFEGNGVNRKALLKIGGYNYSLQNVHIRYSGSVGLSILGGQVSLINVESELNDSIGLYIYRSRSISIIASSFESNPIGIYITSIGDDGVRIRDNCIRIISPYFEQNDVNVILNNTVSVSIENPYYADQWGRTLQLQGDCFDNVIEMNHQRVIVMLDSLTHDNVFIKAYQFFSGVQYWHDKGTNNKIVDH